MKPLKIVGINIWIIFLLLGSPAAHAQSVGFFIEGKKNKVTIPFEIHNNLIIIPIKINGILPLKFILDTGVKSTILVDKSYLEILDVDLIREINLKGIGERQIVKAFVTGTMTLNLPGVIGTQQSLIVLDEDYLKLRNHLGTDVHGIIGYELFSRFVVRINYLRKEIVLYDISHFKKKIKHRSLDIEIEEAKPYINLPLDLNDSVTVHTRLLVDIGSSHALVLHRDLNDSIFLPEPNIKSNLGRGIAGEIDGHLARIKGFGIGGERLKDVIVSYPDQRTFNDTLIAVARDGSIGGEVFKKFTVTFDYYHKKIYLKPNYTIRHTFEYNMSGLEIVNEGPLLDKFMVAHVRDNSAASEQDIQEGDMVVEINGVSAENLTLTRIYNLLNSREGKRIYLVIERKGKVIKRKFHLRREI